MNAITLTNLRKSYQTFDLGPLNLQVPTGSVYALVGPNGAGKTTLIEVLYGMASMDGGYAELLGYDVLDDLVEIKKQSALVSPRLDFRQWKDIEQAMRFVRGFYPDTWDQGFANEWLKRFALHPSDRIASLSLGAHMKLAIVIALARRPKLLILDEPTTGLDAVAKDRFYAGLLELMSVGEHTVLIASHQLGDLERFADGLAFLHRGQCLLSGPVNEVLAAFATIDFQLHPEIELDDENVHFVYRHGARARALVRSDEALLRKIRQAGASHIEETPVNLEELFVSLVR